MKDLTIQEVEQVNGGFIMVACAIGALLVTALGAGIALGAADDASSSLQCTKN